MPLLVHRCRFVESMPSAVTSLAFSPSRRWLALGRANGNIEIWNCTVSWFQEIVLCGEGESQAARSLVWLPVSKESETRLAPYEGRLFSAGLDGRLVEWDFGTLRPASVLQVHGGGVWCLSGTSVVDDEADSDDSDKEKDGSDVESSEDVEMESVGEEKVKPVQSQVRRLLLAAACEDGKVRTFRVTQYGGVEVHGNSMFRFQGRALCVAWHESGTKLVAGGSDATIRIMNAHTGNQIHRMTTTNYAKNPTLVWSTAFLRDGTIVTGSSLGDTEFWDGNTGVLQQSMRHHNADVTGVAFNGAENAVVSAGIDSKIVSYTLLPGSNGSADSWKQDKGRRHHTHDISAVIIGKSVVPAHGGCDLIVSGGIDTQLVIQDLAERGHESHKSITRRLAPTTARKPFCMSSANRCMMQTNGSLLNLWRLGQADAPSKKLLKLHENYASLPLVNGEQLLLQLDLEATIVDAAISPDGDAIAVLTAKELQVFNLQGDENTVEGIRRVSLGELKDTCGNAVAFAGSSTRLVVAELDAKLSVIDIAEAAVLASFDQHQDGGAETCIRFLSASADGQWLASSDGHNHIHTFNLDTLQHQAQLPVFDVTHTAIGLHPTQGRLVVTCADNRVYEFDLEEKELTAWSKKHSHRLPRFHMEKREVLQSISFNPARPTRVLLQARSYFCMVDFSQPVPKDDNKNALLNANGMVGTGKRKRGTKEERGTSKPKLSSYKNFYYINHYKPLLYAGFAQGDELAVIERPWAQVLAELPPPVYRHKYGS